MSSNRKPFSDQIKVLMDEYGTGKLSALTDISDTMLRKWRAGTSSPGLEKLLALSDATGVTLEWLTTGLGDKYYPPEKMGCFDPQGDYHVNPISNDEFALIPMYDAEVSMGSGAWNDHDNIVSKLAFRRDWLGEEDLKPEKCALILARGDSMEETIADGATILINLEDNVLSRDGVYVIRFDGHLLAKRLQRSYDGSVFIKSDNKAYNEIHVPANQVNNIDIVGRVAWYASII